MGADLHFAGTKGGLRSLLWAGKRAEREQHPRFVRFMDEAALGQRQGGAEGRALGVGKEPNGTGRVEIGTGTVGRGQGRGECSGLRTEKGLVLSLPPCTYIPFIWTLDLALCEAERKAELQTPVGELPCDFASFCVDLRTFRSLP